MNPGRSWKSSRGVLRLTTRPRLRHSGGSLAVAKFSDDVAQGLDHDRLEQDVGEACRLGALLVFFHRVAGHRDRGNAPPSHELMQQVAAIAIGQADVEQEEIEVV